MATYAMYSQVTVSAYTKVEAENDEEAMEIAKNRAVVIGGIHTGNSEEESWIIDEADGVPTDIRFE